MHVRCKRVHAAQSVRKWRMDAVLCKLCAHVLCDARAAELWRVLWQQKLRLAHTGSCCEAVRSVCSGCRSASRASRPRPAMTSVVMLRRRDATPVAGGCRRGGGGGGCPGNSESSKMALTDGRWGCRGEVRFAHKPEGASLQGDGEAKPGVRASSSDARTLYLPADTCVTERGLGSLGAR